MMSIIFGICILVTLFGTESNSNIYQKLVGTLSIYLSTYLPRYTYIYLICR